MLRKTSFPKAHLIAFGIIALSLLPMSFVQAEETDTAIRGILAQIERVLQSQLASLSSGQVLGAETIVVNNDAELHAAILKVTGGETIQLNPGTYSRISIAENEYPKVLVGSLTGKRTAKLKSHVTIISKDDNNRAVVASIATKSSPYWRFEGLSIRPPAKAIAIEVHSDYNVITRNDITYGDAEDWTIEQWNLMTGTAISIRSGKDVEVSKNYLKNVDFGIGIDFNAPNARVIGNTIDTFNGDAMRGLGDNGLFENNIVKNAIQTDSNHSDGFQSWRNYTNNNRPVENVTVRHNSFYGLQEHPFSSKMQGIGLFDGPYKGWLIENNLLILDTYHGINISGAIDTTVRHNLVVDVNTERPNTWMRIGNVKTSYTGAPSENSFMENNVSTNPVEGSVGVTYTNNKKITYAEYGTYFVDHKNGDWTVKPGALAFPVGANSVTNTPPPVVTTPPPTPEPSPTPAPSTNPTPTPTTNSPLPTPEVSNNPTPVVTEEEEAVQPKKELKKITLHTTAEVFNEYGYSIGQQEKGASGTYDKAVPTALIKYGESVWVDFQSGLDGYVHVSSFATEKTTETKDDTRSVGKGIVTLERLNVRSTPGGSIVAVKEKGTSATIDTNVPAQTVNGYAWVFVSFSDGTKGYVAKNYVSEVAPANADAIRAQIAVLLAQIKVLQEKIAQMKSN